ncbi:hypothetical protein EBQ90_08600 [bacterium]|nr:hypothetical protein [bacterium]
MILKPKSFLLSISCLMLLVFYWLGSISFFRHDDWIMLGNAISFLPKDWSFLWESRLYFSPTHLDVWFFRPLFKASIWTGFQLFGMNHTYWVLFQFLSWLIAIGWGALAFKNLDSSNGRAYWFTCLALCNVSAYFASVVWVGEGMMNIPQVVLLSAALFCFLKATPMSFLISVVCYLISLGYKESSVFFPLLLFGVDYYKNRLSSQKLKLSIFFGVMGCYLVWRLGFVPINPGYQPQVSWTFLFKPFIFFLLFLSIPAAALAFSGLRFSHGFSRPSPKIIPLLLFLLLLVLPHLGHPFFSPGWLLLPGFFSIWVLVFLVEPSLFKSVSLVRTGILCGVISLLPVIWQCHQIRWLEWSQSQKAIHAYIKNFSDPTVSQIEIEICPVPHQEHITFERVVGASENMEHLWLLYHSTPMKFVFISCSPENQTPTPPKGTAKILWKFPDVQFF